MTNTEANELSAQLWRQRELLEMLLFKYQEEQLLRAAGMDRWSGHAERETQIVVERLSTCSLSTAVAISGAATAWGLPAHALLRDLAEGAPSGMWRDILTEHLDALVDMISEIRDLRSASSGTYRPDGSLDHIGQTARLIDAVL
jgi:hypothetical protein